MSWNISMSWFARFINTRNFSPCPLSLTLCLSLHLCMCLPMFHYVFILVYQVTWHLVLFNEHIFISHSSAFWRIHDQVIARCSCSVRAVVPWRKESCVFNGRKCKGKLNWTGCENSFLKNLFSFMKKCVSWTYQVLNATYLNLVTFLISRL